uniref:C2 domain-containing protein n=1 Tax=Syphacia muris TaxID=451379 RepID=A0A0N5AW81_9BILA
MNLQKRSTATIFCTLTEPDVNTDHNESEKIELIVKVHRCSKLDMLTKNKLSPSSYVTYEFYDFYPASTEVVHKNANPEFNSTKVWTLSNGPELIAYLRVAEICFAIMEEELNEKHSNKQLGYVIIPLYPLSHNNPIIGTFLITAVFIIYFSFGLSSSLYGYSCFKF